MNDLGQCETNNHSYYSQYDYQPSQGYYCPDRDQQNYQQGNYEEQRHYQNYDNNGYLQKEMHYQQLTNGYQSDQHYVYESSYNNQNYNANQEDENLCKQNMKAQATKENVAIRMDLLKDTYSTSDEPRNDLSTPMKNKAHIHGNFSNYI